MYSDQPTVPGKRFFVIVAGKTNGAHQQIVDDLKRCGQVEVDQIDDAHYLLVFCPIASRTGTDISEALSRVPDDKSIILVVMHHTYDHHHIVAESRRQVDNPHVILTVDYLFRDGKILTSNRNEISLHEIKKVLGAPLHQISSMQTVTDGLKRNWRIILICSSIVLVILAFVIFCILYFGT